MLSLKEFKDFSLEANHQINTVGGQCECIVSSEFIDHYTDTGHFVEEWGFNADGDVVKHEFYDYYTGEPYDGSKGEK